MLNGLGRAILGDNIVARRLTLAVIAFSSAITIMTTAVDLYFVYRADMERVEARFHEIGSTQLRLLTESVWALNEMQINAQLDGMSRLSGIEAAVIRSEGQAGWHAGSVRSRFALTRIFPLTRIYRGQDTSIGELEVTASLDEIYFDLLDRLVRILVSNGIKAALVAVFVLMMFQLMVTRHLHAVTAFAETPNPAGAAGPILRLNRPGASGSRLDELDRLVVAINTMRTNLSVAYLALKRSEANYRGIFDNAPNGIFRFTASGEIVIANPGFAALLSRSLEPRGGTSIGGWLINAFVDEDDRTRFFESCANHNEVVAFETRWRRADGGVIWVKLDVRKVDVPGEDGLFFDATARDITERVEAEAKLRKAMEEVLAASRAKSLFLANMSHELRTPLNAIIGFSDMIRSEIHGRLGDSRYRGYAEDINSAGNLLLALITDVLDIARIENGRLEIGEQPLNLADVAANSLRIVSQTPEGGKVSFRTEVEPDLPLLRGDRRLISQIAINLLSNASKFSPVGGVVCLNVGRDPSGGLFLSVADSGPGIAPEDMETALTPFGQIDSGYGRREGGAGLGLPLAKAFAEAHGARLLIESAHGAGTRVMVTFPVDRSLPPGT